MSKGMIMYSRIGCDRARFFRCWPHRCGQTKENVCTCMYMRYYIVHTIHTHITHSNPRLSISSLDQLSFPLLATCVAHFRVITLDLLNHCVLVFISKWRKDLNKRAKKKKKKHTHTSEPRAKRIQRHARSLSLHWLYFSALSYPCSALCSLKANLCQSCVSMIAAWIW